MIGVGDMIGVMAALIINAGALLFLFCLWAMIYFILVTPPFDVMDVGVLIGIVIGSLIGIKIFQEERARGAI